MPIPPTFNPSNGQWGVYPSIPSGSMPGLWVGHASCNEQGYLIGVLKFKAGHPSLYCAPNYGPWVFSTLVRQAVKDLQAFFGQAQTGVVDAACWEAVRICANA